MPGEAKTREQLVDEIEAMRQQLAALKLSVDEYALMLEALQDSETRYRRLFETAQDGILLLDAATGKITDVNPYLIEMLGYSHTEFVGRNLWEIGTFRDIEASRDAFLELQTKEYVRYEDLPLETKDRRSIDVEFVSNVYEVNHHKVIQCNIREITARRRLEREKARLEDHLRHAQKMEAIGTLAGGIAHDFNNILAAILGFTELTLLLVPKGSQEHYNLTQVLTAGERAKELVKQILTFSRKASQERRPLEINAIINEALKLLRASLPTTIDIQQNLSHHSFMVFADPTQLHQILMNLCSNAAHAMGEKGGILEVNLEKIHLGGVDPLKYPGLTQGPYVKLTVSDTGQGIDQEIIGRIFEPFFTTKEVGEGTGMGLAMVHGIVKSYGGEVTVSSQPEQGTTFTILLPEFMGEVGTRTAATAPLPTGNDSILFIDDEEMLVNMSREILKKLGYQVVAKTSSLEALKIFQAQPGKFDLVITDQTMPHMTGMQLAQEFRHLRPDIPIILCTGYSDKVSKDKLKAAGINELLMKPFIIHNLAATIRKVLD